MGIMGPTARERFLMAFYEYRCANCGTSRDTQVRGDSLNVLCAICNETTFHRRVWSVAFKPVMQEHFNNALGGPVSDEKKFAAALRQRSDEAFLHTGIEHKFVPIDMQDAAAVGATNHGIDESNRVRSRIGAPLLPEIK